MLAEYNRQVSSLQDDQHIIPNGLGAGIYFAIVALN